MRNTSAPRTISSLVRVRLNRPTIAYALGLLCGASLTTLLFIFTPPSEVRTHSVFIYGTLQNPIIRSVACLCITTPKPRTLPNYENIGRNIIPNETSVVEGSIIQVNSIELARLDRYERVPKKYLRERIEIDGELHWVYLLNE